MKALITGGSGFIGAELVRRLMYNREVSQIASVSRRGRFLLDDIEFDWPYVYHDIRCDLTEGRDVERLMQAYRPDIVFHLAGEAKVKVNDASLTKSNILSTHNLLANAKPMSRFVLASSATVYGNNAVGDGANESTTLSPNSVYGATKVAAEALVNAYHAMGNISGLCLRYVANVGPGATHGVVKDVVEKLRGRTYYLELLGDKPGSTKHYTHVSDTVEATIQLGLNPAVFGAVNVANDDQLSIEDLVEVIKKTIGSYKSNRWLGESANWKGDNRIVRVDNSLAKSLGWQPRFPKSADAVAAALTQGA